MKVWGITEWELVNMAEKNFGLKLENFRREGKAYRFRTGVLPGTPRRRSAGFMERKGRLVQSPTFARMAVFILGLFTQGAYRVQSSMGDWTKGEQFIRDLDRIFDINVGSQMYPVNLGHPSLNQSDPEMEEALEKFTRWQLEGEG